MVTATIPEKKPGKAEEAVVGGFIRAWCSNADLNTYSGEPRNRTTGILLLTFDQNWVRKGRVGVHYIP